jgi:dehydrogenase/reductase SDR family protein 4
MDVSYLSLEGKVALIAGASVAISGRKLPALQEAAAEIGEQGGRVLPVEAHNRKPEDLRNLVETVKSELGRLDILVNNAAANPVMAPLVEIEEATFDVIMNTNLKGYFILSQLAAKLMMEQGGGSILNISSVGGVSPDKGLGVYCISKAAVNMLTRALALELGEHNITVNALALGVVQTRFSQALWSNEKLIAEEMSHTPLGRISQPEEVARMALAVVSEAGSYMTGQIIVMDGGGSI